MTSQDGLFAPPVALCRRVRSRRKTTIAKVRRSTLQRSRHLILLLRERSLGWSMSVLLILLSETLCTASTREQQVTLLTTQLSTLLERAEVDAAFAAEAKKPEQHDLQAFLQ